MKRHALSTRLWHWLNLVALVVLFMSGLNISNAHRYLYWGNYGYDPEDAWTAVMRFPGWATIPGYYDLAAARDWHTLAAWPFALGLLAMWVMMLVNGHFVRDLATAPRDWSPAALAEDIRAHLSGRFHSEGAQYNILQRIAYGAVLGILLPLMVLTGLAISPGFEPAAPWLVDAVGGRQSARSLHFLCAWAVLGFVLVHVAMVLVSGPLRQMRGMIAGGKRENPLG